MATVRSFGFVPAGEVHAIRLSRGDIEVELLSLGAVIRSITVPDRSGSAVDVALGYDTPQEYLAQSGYLGAVVGRCANRTANACFTLNGTEYRLTVNNGKNHLHGGTNGFSHRIWSFAAEEYSVTFSLHSEDGDQGYPGAADVSVTYTLTEENALELHYTGSCDRDTVLSLTNHNYFNLGGHGSGTVGDHLLTVHAARYTPCNAESIPTGEILPVAGTALDFTVPTAVGTRWDDPMLAIPGGVDHNLVLDGAPVAAELYCAATGIVMETLTDLPGIQVYSGNYLTDRAGKGGARYDRRHGICLETQVFPDSIHHENFPSPILRAGAQYDTRTLYRFSTR